MAINFKQGEDLILEIVITDRNNQKVSLTTAGRIRVGFSINNRVFQRYLDTTLEPNISGYGEVFVDALDDTKLNVYITREQSREFPVGEFLYANILIEFADTALEAIADEYQYIIGSVLPGLLKDEDLTL